MGTRSVLLVSNRRPEDAGGRAEKVATRKRLLADHDWDVVIGYVPEPYILLFVLGLWRNFRAGLKNDVDVVISINNPFHLHLVGYLVSRLLGVPWIAEFRDPILPRPDLNDGSLLRYPAGYIERLAVKQADRVLWYDGIQMADEYFERTYPNVSADQFRQLPFMGYEKAKFEGAESRTFDRFTITYAGSFYEGWIEPYDFLEGLGTYADRVDDLAFIVQFYGDWNADYDAAVADAGVGDHVETHEFVPHEEIVPVLKGSDAVLYIGGDDPDNARNIPSKIFDYVGARTPILAIVDPTFRVASFIEDNGLGIVAPPGDPEAASAAIERLRTGSFEYNPDPEIFETFTREQTAERIARELDGVVDRPAD